MTTNPATTITYSTVVLNGVVTPNGYPTTIQFQYGVAPNDSGFPNVPIPPLLIGAGLSPVPISYTLTGLASNNIVSRPYTTYNFRAVAVSGGGSISYPLVGLSQTFTTRNQPMSLDTPPASSGASNAWTYGYRFYPITNGYITALGRYSASTGNTTVRLWVETGTGSTGTQIGIVASIPSAIGWQWQNLTPPGVRITVPTGGLYYRVSVDCSSTVWYASYPVTTPPYYPLNKGNIIITGGDYYNNGGTGYPASQVGASWPTMYGWPDVEFLPDQ